MPSAFAPASPLAVRAKAPRKEDLEEESPAPSPHRRSRRRGRRRRRRRPSEAANGPAAAEPAADSAAASAEPAGEVEGVLSLPEKGAGVLVSARNNYLPSPRDVLVPRDFASREQLAAGARIAGRASGGHRRTLTHVERIEGLPPEEFRARPPFSDLISVDPDERLVFETEPDEMCGRVVDLVCPIGRGQRCLIVAPPKTGKTTLLKRLAHAVSENHPDVELMVLLVDERPEEVTDFRRSIRGDVIASSSDLSAENHIAVAEIVLERARRIIECGRHAIIFLDSITRLSRAYNQMQKGAGKIMSGGIDARTMEKPRRFFGAARNAEDHGSLTIIATALVDTGSRMDEVIFQEFKGTGNTEVVLDRELFDRRLFPTIYIQQSGTRKEEKLYSPADLPKIHKLRRALAGTHKVQAMELLLQRLQKFKTNADFLGSF
jgi:transcription termination factor Rho